jgi:hypothetical protein
MAQPKISTTYEDRRDPQFINVAALEAEHNIVNRLIQRDRRRGWREWAMVGVIGLLGFVVYDQAMDVKVVAYRVNEDLAGVERAELLEPFTVDASILAEESRQWLEHVRIVSSDKVVEDKLHNAAVRRMDTVTLQQQITAYIKNQVQMPNKGTRDVLENTFGFSQLSNGENGLYTFVWSWYERESFGFVPKNAFEMQATVTMKVRPPTRKELRAGQLDGLFVSYFDIRATRQLTLEELDRIVARK